MSLGEQEGHEPTATRLTLLALEPTRSAVCPSYCQLIGSSASPLIGESDGELWMKCREGERR
eukprot:10702665-Alexandrium_andersonii.AAC.1